MFEHFGIKDIWYCAKKNIILLTVILVSCSMFFGVLSIFKIKNTLSSDNQSNEKIAYLSNYTFYVDIYKNDNFNNKKFNLDIYNFVSNNYVSILSGDICAKYIIDKLLEEYTEEEVLEKIKLDNKDSLDIDTIKNFYFVNHKSGTMIIELFSASYDEVFCEKILKICNEFLNKLSKDNEFIDNLNLIGSSKKILPKIDDFKKLLLDPKNSESQSMSKSSRSKLQIIVLCLAKNLFLPVTGILFLVIILLCIITLFNPRINTKSDFSEFGINVIGEIN